MELVVYILSIFFILNNLAGELVGQLTHDTIKAIESLYAVRAARAQYLQKILDADVNSTALIPTEEPLDEVLRDEQDYYLDRDGGEEYTSPLETISHASVLRNSCWDPNIGLAYARKCKQACRATYSNTCTQRGCPNGVYNRAYGFCRITCRLKFCP